MRWQHLLRQWFVLALVLVCVTSCELEQYGTYTETHPTDGAEKLDCEPGEYEYKGQCVPAGLPPDMPCPPGETLLDDGRCQPAGLPLDMQCPPGELPLDNGGCQPAGVPPEMCGEGFEPDGNMGCNAILPKDPCPFGLMAVPGETECHEVAPCGKLPYPAVVYDALEPPTTPTQFVNAAYGANDSDGSMLKPWKTIQDGIDAAAPGAIVAIAEGTYEENLLIEKQVKLWGVCPKKVVRTASTSIAPIVEAHGAHASGTEIHDLAVAGLTDAPTSHGPSGIEVNGSRDVVIDRVWIHDTSQAGLHVWDDPEPASATVSGSLIESTHKEGLELLGADVTIERCVVRGTLEFDGLAIGIAAWNDVEFNRSAEISLRSSLVEEIDVATEHTCGIGNFGSVTHIETTAIRSIAGPGLIIVESPINMHANAMIRKSMVENTVGAGIEIQESSATIAATVVKKTHLDPVDRAADGIRIGSTRGYGKVAISASTIENIADVGIRIMQAEATIEASIIRGTGSMENTAWKTAIAIAGNPAMPHLRYPTTIRGCKVLNNKSTGVVVQGTDMILEATIVRGHGETGVEIDNYPGTSIPASAIVQTSLIEQNRIVGTLVNGSNVLIEKSVVRETQPGTGNLLECGVCISDRDGVNSIATIHNSLIERNHWIGVGSLRSNTTLEESIVRGTLPNGNGEAGYGIDFEQSVTSTRNTLVENNHGAGVLFVDSDAVLERSLIRGTRHDDKLSGGLGIHIRSDKRPANSTIRSCVVEKNEAVGIFGLDADVTIESTVVRDTQVDGHLDFGRGIDIEGSLNANIQRSLIDSNFDTGIFVSGSRATIAHTIVRNTKLEKDGLFGRGITIQSSDKASIIHCHVDRNYEVGVLVGDSSASIENTSISTTMANAEGKMGDGILVLSEKMNAAANVANVRVDASERVNISNFGGSIKLASSTLSCELWDVAMQTNNNNVPTFVDMSGNLCGCPNPTGVCRTADVELEPPTQLPRAKPLQPPTKP